LVGSHTGATNGFTHWCDNWWVHTLVQTIGGFTHWCKQLVGSHTGVTVEGFTHWCNNWWVHTLV
jgi:hypothetical protein